jgi:predicted small lipoprotein YifL
MPRWFPIVLIALAAAACGQKGPLVLPEDARRKQTPPPAHDVPPAQDPTQ